MTQKKRNDPDAPEGWESLVEEASEQQREPVAPRCDQSSCGEIEPAREARDPGLATAKLLERCRRLRRERDEARQLAENHRQAREVAEGKAASLQEELTDVEARIELTGDPQAWDR